MECRQSSPLPRVKKSLDVVEDVGTGFGSCEVSTTIHALALQHCKRPVPTPYLMEWGFVILARELNKEREMAKTDKQRMWTRRIAEWERSGMSRRTWCAANEVSVHTFDYWRRRLREQPLTSASPRQTLMPVVVKSAPFASSPAAIEIALPSGIALRAQSMVDARWLAALVREIGAC